MIDVLKCIHKKINLKKFVQQSFKLKFLEGFFDFFSIFWKLDQSRLIDSERLTSIWQEPLGSSEFSSFFQIIYKNLEVSLKMKVIVENRNTTNVGASNRQIFLLLFFLLLLFCFGGLLWKKNLLCCASIWEIFSLQT